MSPDQGDNFWKEAESQGTMPQADNVISGEVQPTQEIPLGASHFAMFPQTNDIGLSLSNRFLCLRWFNNVNTGITCCDFC